MQSPLFCALRYGEQETIEAEAIEGKQGQAGRVDLPAQGRGSYFFTHHRQKCGIDRIGQGKRLECPPVIAKTDSPAAKSQSEYHEGYGPRRIYFGPVAYPLDTADPGRTKILRKKRAHNQDMDIVPKD